MQRRARHIQPTDIKRKAIGAAVAEFRRAAGFSQERLSADCGFERTYLSRVERGILNPTAIRVWTIADALKVPFRELVGRMETWAVEHARRWSGPSLENETSSNGMSGSDEYPARSVSVLRSRHREELQHCTSTIPPSAF